jgi:hypothetical protein
MTVMRKKSPITMIPLVSMSPAEHLKLQIIHLAGLAKGFRKSKQELLDLLVLYFDEAPEIALDKPLHKHDDLVDILKKALSD